MESKKAYFKKTFSRFGQLLYLTISNFTKNALWESAAACSFGFIFSSSFLRKSIQINHNTKNIKNQQKNSASNTRADTLTFFTYMVYNIATDSSFAPSCR